MLYFSSRLQKEPYQPAAERLFAALKQEKIPFAPLHCTKDIWLRDFMPVKTKSGKYISFRYEPSYLETAAQLKTDYKEIENQIPISVEYSEINLDGGNVVFSPAKQIAVISDRVFSENPRYGEAELKSTLQKQLEAEIIIIPSLQSDMTGHADGMVRFVDENTVLVNESEYPNGLESRIKKVLQKCGLKTVDFPYFETKHKSADGVSSAEGCYINFLETESVIFVPIFDCAADEIALRLLGELADKKTVGVPINEIARHGGLLNCISWEL